MKSGLNRVRGVARARRWLWVMGMMGALTIVPAAFAAEPARGLLVDYVSPSLLDARAAPQSAEKTREIHLDALADSEHNDWAMVPAPRDLTSGERWERFEAEFGVGEQDPSFVKGRLETAKYQLDKTLFAVDEFLEGLEEALEFDYEVRTMSRAPADKTDTKRGSSNMLRNALENARFKSDIDLHVAGSAFVGLKLVLPLGY